MFNNDYSLSDIAAASGRNNGSWGNGDGAWLIIILFLFIFMGWGNGNSGWGNNNASSQGALTRGELAQDMNFQQVENGVRGIQQGLCDGFYSQNTTLLNSFGNVQRDLCTGFSSVAQGFDGVNANIADTRYAMQDCCCTTQRSIDSVKAEAYRNTCDITNAIHGEGERTRALIQETNMQNLRDRMAEKDSELQSARFQLSQCSQNAYLVDQLRPTPQPAYLTASPYSAFPLGNAVPFGSNGCSCGCA